MEEETKIKNQNKINKIESKLNGRANDEKDKKK